MKFIYHCFGGSHSSITAAAIHLGLLPDNRPAQDIELLSVPLYDSQVGIDHGRIRFMGWDEKGNEIYITSKRNLHDKYGRIMQQILQLAEGEELLSEVVFINTMPYVNLFMVIGGFLSRRWGSCRLGRRIVCYGTRQSYYKFAQLVRQLKEKYS
ncbi:MAG: DUF3189 family protein [Peptococcia bacterium]